MKMSPLGAVVMGRAGRSDVEDCIAAVFESGANEVIKHCDEYADRFISDMLTRLLDESFIPSEKQAEYARKIKWVYIMYCKHYLKGRDWRVGTDKGNATWLEFAKKFKDLGFMKHAYNVYNDPESRKQMEERWLT